MNSSQADEGVEVAHPKHGRGVITTYDPKFGEETDEVTVRFYDTGDERTLPIFAVELAASVATASIGTGSYGLSATVDDGHWTVELVPNGNGDGYEVVLSVDGQRIDTASVSWA
jgi:hypothetical protein